MKATQKIDLSSLKQNSESLNTAMRAELQHGGRSVNPLQKTAEWDEDQPGKDAGTKLPCESCALRSSVSLLTHWKLAPVSVSEEKVILAFKNRHRKCQAVR